MLPQLQSLIGQAHPLLRKVRSLAPLIDQREGQTRQLQDRHVALLNGSTQYFQYDTGNFNPASELGACIIMSVVKVSSNTSGTVLHDFSTGTYNCVLTSTGFIKVNNFTSGVAYPVDQWFTIEVTYDAGGAVTSVFIDWGDAGITASAGGGTNRSNIRLNLGNGGDTHYVAFQKITLSDGSIYAQWDYNNNGLDSSGNGRHLVAINSPTFSADNSVALVDYDRLNNEGYSISDGTNGIVPIGEIIPPHTTNSDLDALGGKKQFKGSAYPTQLKPIASHARMMNGVDQSILAAWLTGLESVVEWIGSGTEPTVSAGRIDFTVGWYAMVKLSTGVTLHFTNEGDYDLASDGSLFIYANDPGLTTQDDHHPAWEQGYRLYDDTDNPPAVLRVPFVDGVPVDDTFLPSQFVFNADHPAGRGIHNLAETRLSTMLTPSGQQPAVLAAAALPADWHPDDAADARIVSRVISSGVDRTLMLEAAPDAAQQTIIDEYHV